MTPRAVNFSVSVDTPSRRPAPIALVLARLHNAREKSPSQWTAHCCAHNDRSPSLSIRVGRDGAVLVKCFAGCDVVDIVRALGLELRDLFPERSSPQTARSRRPPSAAEVRAFIAREVARQVAIRLERSSYDTPLIRSIDVNAARRRASAFFSIALAPIERFAWEGYEPHDRDPQFPPLFARALEDMAWRWHHFRNPDANAWEKGPLPRRFHPLAADLAVAWLRGLAEGGRGR